MPTCTCGGSGAALPGPLLLDFGQNAVGRLKFRARGVAGTASRAAPGVLEGSELCVRPLRSALATNHFIPSGGDDAFEPAMAFHGFRCAELTGRPEGFPAGDAVNVVVIDVRPVLELWWCSLVLLCSTVVVRRLAG
ncbi:family 78 glycoside hydrolase catalytic domain [Streptomyces bobili]|uniref:family 78 glycoside hydrolase catalytic domain n=1 Tax=Streptomyces bobili TaxID=67280 RepID=UPI0034200595